MTVFFLQGGEPSFLLKNMTKSLGVGTGNSVKSKETQFKSGHVPHNKGNGKIIPCSYCGNGRYIIPSVKREKNYCSFSCSQKGKGQSVRIRMTGRIVSEETKKKLRDKNSGENNWNWKGGKKPKQCPGPNCKTMIAREKISCIKCRKYYRTKEHWDKIHKAVSKRLTGIIPKNMSAPGKYGNVKRGWFDINGKNIFFRSKWEANYALYLDFLVKQRQIKSWEFEPDVFVFEKIKFGTRSYRPDFKVFNNNGTFYYDEIKGHMDAKSKTKIKRMKKYYPTVVLNVIGSKEYYTLQKKLGGFLKFY